MTNMFSKKVVICSVVALGLSVSATAGRSSQAPAQAPAPAAQSQDQNISQCLEQKELCEQAPLTECFEWLGADTYVCEDHTYVVVTDVTETDTIETLQDWANSLDNPRQFPKIDVLAPKMALGCTDQSGNSLQEMHNKLYLNSQKTDTHHHRVETKTIDRRKVQVTYTWKTSRRAPRGERKGEAQEFRYNFNEEFQAAQAKKATSKSRK